MPFRDVVGTSITGVHAWDDDAAVLAPDIARARQPLLCPYEFPDDFLVRIPRYPKFCTNFATLLLRISSHCLQAKLQRHTSEQ